MKLSKLTDIFTNDPNQCDQHKDALSPQVSVALHLRTRKEQVWSQGGEH